MNDYYATLGVSKDATLREIKSAFRKLANQYHPDKNKGSAEAAQRFMQVADAYEVLGDPHKRQMYDRMRGRGNGFEGFGSDDSSDPVDERNPAAEQGQRLSAYILMNIAPTYARGVHALRAACVEENNLNHPKYICLDGSSIYRPLTFKEGIVARLREFNTLHNPDGSARSLDDRLVLFSRWNDSCTGIAKKAGTTKFKIIPVCKELITIAKENKNPFLAVPYDSFHVQELDSSIRTYNQPLPTDKIVDHEGWRAALEYDVPLLRNYSETVVRARELQGRGIPEEIIGFYVWQNTTDADNIGALFVNYLVISSIALGNYNLDNLGSFVRVAPSNFVEIEGKS